jgi:hypothetical protein
VPYWLVSTVRYLVVVADAVLMLVMMMMMGVMGRRVRSRLWVCWLRVGMHQVHRAMHRHPLERLKKVSPLAQEVSSP